ncbi:MAG: DUF1192 domain-containing protein [Alphaproteobacteria bacterium]|nr:DUF1192 domain-containing protein [Alphaproteobacteria bacterium]
MAREDEDLEPRNRKPKPKDLSGLSIEELRDYIADMKAEIARAEETIKAKQSHASAAALFFKKS